MSIHDLEKYKWYRVSKDDRLQHATTAGRRVVLLATSATCLKQGVIWQDGQPLGGFNVHDRRDLK